MILSLRQPFKANTARTRFKSIVNQFRNWWFAKLAAKTAPINISVFVALLG
jgi:hypothetical protein